MSTVKYKEGLVIFQWARAWRATETSKPKGQLQKALALHRPTTKAPTAGPGEPGCLAPVFQSSLKAPWVVLWYDEEPLAVSWTGKTWVV